MKCRHCKVKRSNRPRGLCYCCYRTVRDLYAATSRYCIAGLDYADEPRTPCCPTAARPGSADKMAVMQTRLTAGESLFHPLDAGFC